MDTSSTVHCYGVVPQWLECGLRKKDVHRDNTKVSVFIHKTLWHSTPWPCTVKEVLMGTSKCHHQFFRSALEAEKMAMTEFTKMSKTMTDIYDVQ